MERIGRMGRTGRVVGEGEGSKTRVGGRAPTLKYRAFVHEVIAKIMIYGRLYRTMRARQDAWRATRARDFHCPL